MDQTSMSHPLDAVRIWLQVLFAFLLVLAARGDLWLDEIWSLRFVEEAGSPVELLTRFQHDNNHLLNSLYLYLAGVGRPMMVYRLLAVFSGVGTLMLMGRLARRWGPEAALIAVCLTGVSYPLVLYGSEARGYGPALFFSLLAFQVLDTLMAEDRKPGMFWFWGACFLGVLSHFTFVIVLLSLGIWYLVVMLERRSPVMEIVTDGARLFGVPVCAAGFLYVFFARGMEIGGGPIYQKWDVARRAASMALGFPLTDWYPAVALMCLLILVAMASLQFLKEGSALGVFFPMVIVVAPALLVLMTQPVFLYFRYFLLCVPFLYLLLTAFFARSLHSRRRLVRMFSQVALLGMLLGHSIRILPLLQTGRGGYRKALETMALQTTGEEVVVGSDHDFRNKTLIAFYLPYLRTEKPFAYVDAAARAGYPPEWFITHTQQKDPVPPSVIEVREVGRYNLVETYPYAGVSGWHWFLYRKQNP